MHILLGILGVLGAIAFFIIRANQAGQAGRELLETASDAKALVRRSRWRRKAETDAARKVTDPRLAAGAMMCAMARADGDLTKAQVDEILALMAQHFQATGAEADEIFAQARWLTNEVKDLSSALHRLAPPVAQSCTEQEKRDLLAMLAQVAAVEGAQSDLQRDAISNLRHRLAL